MNFIRRGYRENRRLKFNRFWSTVMAPTSGVSIEMWFWLVMFMLGLIIGLTP